MHPVVWCVAVLVGWLCACGGEVDTLMLGRTDVALAQPFVSSLPALEPGEPIALKSQTWTWVAEPDARCQRDDPTGMFVNLGDPRRLLILLEPGAACFNAASCAIGTLFHSFGAPESDVALSKQIYGLNVFQRDDPSNPFRSFSFVLFPYCSGDIFAGAARAGTGFNGRTQQGYYNVRAYLRRLIATFPAAQKVLLAGVSAGGFGAAFNYDQVQEAFGQATRVYLLDDSGPPLPPEQMSPCLQERWREAWNLDATMPAASACPGCRNPRSDLGIMGIMGYLVSKYPDRRFAILSSTHDWVNRLFLGFGLDGCRALDRQIFLSFPGRLVPADTYAAGLSKLFSDMDAREGAALRGFVVQSSTSHALLVQPGALLSTRVDGVTLGEWLRRLIEDDPAWAHVGLR